MVLDQKQQRRPVVLIKPHPLAQLCGHLDAAGDVVVALPLAYVVQKHREEQQITPLKAGEELRQWAPLLAQRL